jgi:GT2 family glycosyltransferase
MQKSAKIAIVYLSYHCEPYFDDVVNSLKKMTYPKELVEFVVVDNPHQELGPSAPFIADYLSGVDNKDIPHYTILAQSENRGFAGGNNVGIQWALDNGFDFVYLHNQDGFMEANCLEKMLEAMESDQTVGAVQSLLLLHPDTEKLNSSGNSYHYLGFGYCDNFGLDRSKLKMDPVAPIGYASGASVLMRSDLLKKFGLWEKDFFMYHEDIEYSLRLRIAGYKIVIARDALFYHKYTFSRGRFKFYYIERNRFAVVLMYYRLLTILLLLPMALVMEVGMWFFYWRQGWISERARIYKYWITPANVRLWLGKRKEIQKIRVIKDRTLLKNSVSDIDFGEKDINNSLLRYVANPLMTLYWKIIRIFILW